MRITPLLIFVPVLALSSCAKKDLEPEAEVIPAPTPTPTADAPEFPGPNTPNPFRVPNATGKLPDDADIGPSVPDTITPSAPGNDSATVTVRPPAPPVTSGGTE